MGTTEIPAGEPFEDRAAAPNTAKLRPHNIPSLDGFRAIAVSLVFVAHAGLEKYVPGGFGVTLFFFLSGYLITTLMRMEFDKASRVSIPKFYMRRVLRIFPPLYITTTLAVLAWLFHVFPNLKTETGQPWVTSWDGVASHYFFFTNYFTLYSDFNGAPGCGPLWSLAVEEHFYLLFPLVFSFILVRRPAKGAAMILIAFCASVLLWRTYIAYATKNFAWTYLATDTRLDSIAFGCILAIFRNPFLDDEVREKPPSMAWFWAGLLGLLVCFLVRESSFGGRGVYFRETVRYSIQGLALMPIFTVAILKFDKWPFTWLNTWTAKWIAAFSYTIYLFHYLAFLLVEEFVMKRPAIVEALRPLERYTGPVSLTLVVTAMLAAVVVLAYAWTLYAFIEKPAAKLRKRFS